MSDRASPGAEGPPACPFVAFADERDERSSSPDHRHRCYAEVEPAPRALAHQEAYCLSSAFPVCPTFQDWARREAAQARSSGRAAVAPPAMSAAINDEREADAGTVPDQPIEVAAAAGGPGDADTPDEDADPWAAPPHENEPVIHRNPPRDWAAPPPWATGGPGGPPAGGAGAPPTGGSGGPRKGETAPDFLASREAGRGLAGSAADRLASGSPAAIPRGASSSPSAAPSDELAGLVGPAASASASPRDAPAPLNRPPSGAYPTTTASGRRPTVSSTRSRPPQHDGPSWESAKRYEAYPTIKTRAGLPGIPRIAIWAGALGVAALALFFLPALLGFGGNGPGASPTPSTAAAAATASPDPTPVPEPTPQTYTIKTNDTLLKIAKKYGLTLDELLAANKDTIKNPDKIKVGQVIVIPVHTPDEVTDPSAATPTSSPSPKP